MYDTFYWVEIYMTISKSRYQTNFTNKKIQKNTQNYLQNLKLMNQS